jgi:hypothetical protein
MIAPADIPFVNANGEVNTFSWIDSNGETRTVNAEDIKRVYEEKIAGTRKNAGSKYPDGTINGDIDALEESLRLDSPNTKERNYVLSQIMMDEIINSSRYGLELFQACTIDKETGEFHIPPGDATQAKRIEQLFNSLIKSRINKREIAGGPIVQVSNFGMSKLLHIRFHTKDGGILLLKEEFLKSPSLMKKYNSYEDYCAENQAGMAYKEVLLPAWTKNLFSMFMDAEGNIDIDSIELLCPALLK